MKTYTRPRHDASLGELRAAMEQLDNDIYSGDRRAVDCCEEMNRLDRLIQRAEAQENRPRSIDRPRSPETPFPEGI